ncbi:cytochrome P450 [Halocatena marina]|uniref:cytochrome P450 n=1 Tax=Halocatena marina TaxID=2934937 RepID=UPI00200E516E|nr:cytochrome P450 [Halocatena marina]
MADDSGNQPPVPDGLPVLGNTLDFIRSPMSFIGKLPKHGDIVRCEFPMIRAVALFHPEDIRTVLLADQQTYRRWNFDQLRKMGGYDFAPEGLAFTEGEKWRNQRRHLQSMFGLDRLHGYADTMVEHTERVLKQWEDGAEIALNHAFSELSLAVLTHSLFDFDMRERGEPIIRATETLNDRAQLGGRNAVEFLLPSWIPTPGHARYREAMDDFDTVVDELITERRANPVGYDDLLARMLATESDSDYTMSDAEIHDQMLAFLFAGHETTATTLTFTWLLLSTHPEKRKRLDAEIEDVLGGAPPSPERLDALTYTEQVIKEALRLYPPAAMLFRKNLTETEIGGHTVPANSTILLPQFVVHTDERWYDDPQTFRPERWDSRRERPEYAYFPFGGGGHHCIGMRFAMMELKHVIPIIAQRVDFELLSTPDPAVQMEMTLQPTEDIRARVTKRSSRY